MAYSNFVYSQAIAKELMITKMPGTFGYIPCG
jgi:hypothetical protein